MKNVEIVKQSLPLKESYIKRPISETSIIRKSTANAKESAIKTLKTNIKAPLRLDHNLDFEIIDVETFTANTKRFLLSKYNH